MLVRPAWTWATLTGADKNPRDPTSPGHPIEWLITLFVVPTALAVVGFLTWRRSRRHTSSPSVRG